MASDRQARDRQALVGLGGNIGGHVEILQRFRAAVAALEERLAITALESSPVYRSQPVGPVPDQPVFLNAVLRFQVPAHTSARALLSTLLDIETALGRQREHDVPQGPRTIDLDLLFVGEDVMRVEGPPRLELPHPRVLERAFVLRPLADLMGEGWTLPAVHRTVGQCLADPAVAAQDRALKRHAPARWLRDDDRALTAPARP